jgi:sugar lactone lactonase YvrE
MMPELTQRWMTDGFAQPESPAYDPTRGVIYVSNMTDSTIPVPDHGDGFLTKLDTDGATIEPKWLTGLSQVKNIAVHGDWLYAADSHALVVIDIDAATIVARYDAPNSMYIDGVAVHPNGDVYVGDLGKNTIWRLTPDGGWAPWLESDLLHHPDGLIAEEDRLIAVGFGGLGPFRTDPDEPETGYLSAIGLADRSVTPIGDGTPIGHLDGLAAHPAGGYLATDSINGALFTIDDAGRTRLVHDFPSTSGPADIDVIADLGLVLVAMLFENAVRAFELPDLYEGQSR